MAGAVLSIEALGTAVDDGSIDTVVVAMVDMQGRLQGKRLDARFFLDETIHHGTEGCNYLLAVDVEMNTVDGYRISSWDTGYGDFALSPGKNESVRALTNASTGSVAQPHPAQ